MQFSKRFLWLVNSASLAFPCFLAAQEDQEQEQDGTGVHYLEEIHVTGVLSERSANELAQSISVIREQTLERIAAPIWVRRFPGQLGVSSSYFGAGFLQADHSRTRRRARAKPWRTASIPWMSPR